MGLITAAKDPQNTVLDKSIAKISSTKYGLKANRKNKSRLSSKNVYSFWVTDLICKKLNQKYKRDILYFYEI